MRSNSLFRSRAFKRTVLAVALSSTLAGGVVYAQSTTGTIFGQAEANETVTVDNGSGFVRQVAVDASGRYAVNALPLGTYTVTLNRAGAVVDSRKNVTLRVGSGTEVSFASSAGSASASNLEGVTVSAAALPAIDVTSVDSRTVITSQDLARLPLGRSAEAIALLAPGVTPGSGYFTGPGNNALVSFGGSSVTENAYYINGFNTTDPLSGFGGLTLPYGAIDQQELLQGGYSAAYGRSDGGVISQVGKRGTNDWHFGGQVQFTPKGLRSDQNDIRYVQQDGKYRERSDAKSWTTTADAYVGGPLIADKLFFFAAVEGERQVGKDYGAVTGPYERNYQYSNPKWYTKLDWNINDSNVLEVTGASAKSEYKGNEYDYDYDTGKKGGFQSYDTSTKNGADLVSGKFTSYITDDLNISVLLGKLKGVAYSITPGASPLPNITDADQQDPALNGGSPISNANTVNQLLNPAHRYTNVNLRFDVNYHIGDHQLTAGIDNQTVNDYDDSTVTSGPGYYWDYTAGAAGTPIIGEDINSPPYVAPPGGNGHYVAKVIYANGASVRTTQRAQYIEDTWQVSDRWMVKVGVRNDQFTNYNGDGDPYIRLTRPQFAPRLGATWDVNGDSSMKLYANAGRYYLALPASVALRSAGSSLFTSEYFNYTGIDGNGVPTGLTPIYSSTGGPISANNEYGQARDPKTAAASNLKSEYQDEFILGFTQQLAPQWIWGAKASYRKLRNAIDDVGDSGAIAAKMEAMGIDPATIGPIAGSYLFNPGKSNTFEVQNLNGGYYNVKMTNDDFGFNTHLKRSYYAMELFLEHQFDGKWYGKIDYLYSRSYGNSEGQVRSDIGQTDVSATVDWDYAQVMDYANGALSNDRPHQLKAYGSYQLTSEWMLSGNLSVMSGAPKTCLGYYGAEEGNPGLGYGSFYHFCGGQQSQPGTKRNPFNTRVDLSAEYRPDWGQKRLAFQASVFNVFNSQKTLQTYPYFNTSDAVNPSYNRPVFTQAPRSVRFGITYDY
ncbi:TonB-dependent receptor [Pinirhizobacter soli]|uniref:TonB-dependent receptor n=1 Tax=Pinirhizobacter soli TaxID=2786953 RepID=UPI00202A6062|nr:TonB-dependent receptor [Pinirhizobacter soli]